MTARLDCQNSLLKLIWRLHMFRDGFQFAMTMIGLDKPLNFTLTVIPMRNNSRYSIIPSHLRTQNQMQLSSCKYASSCPITSRTLDPYRWPLCAIAIITTCSNIVWYNLQWSMCTRLMTHHNHRSSTHQTHFGVPKPYCNRQSVRFSRQHALGCYRSRSTFLPI